MIEEKIILTLLLLLSAIGLIFSPNSDLTKAFIITLIFVIILALGDLTKDGN